MLLIKEKIKSKFHDNDERLLFAGDVGSQNWGIANQDSDYDIKGIHIRSKDQLFDFAYKGQNISKIIIGVDFISYDIDHFFELVNKNNPTVFDMLNSNLVLINELVGFDEFKEKVMSYFDIPCLSKNFFSYANGKIKSLEVEGMSYKQAYLAIRPLLIASVLAFGELPALSFQSLLDQAREQSLLTKIGRTFIERKKEGADNNTLSKSEASYIIEIISDFAFGLRVDLKRQPDMAEMTQYLKTYAYKLKSKFYDI